MVATPKYSAASPASIKSRAYALAIESLYVAVIFAIGVCCFAASSIFLLANAIASAFFSERR